MEESGHYYTVYYTSLAVGFKEDIAYQHALLAQMPDEVSWLDAANMHIKQCLFQSENNLNGVSQNVPPAWRYSIEYGLHSLPGKNLNANTRSSAYQRRQTTLALANEDAASLAFGLLLHRLGDTYAHSKINDQSTMYTVSTGDQFCISNPLTSIGHGHHVHAPDFPFLRRALFFSYLENLYEVLLNKVQEASSKAYSSGAPARPYHEVLNDFKAIFSELDYKVRDESRFIMNNTLTRSKVMGAIVASNVIGDVQKATWLIATIRNAAVRNLKITMKPYKPENYESLTLDQFLKQHPQLNKLKINSKSVAEAVNNAIPQNATPPKTMYQNVLEGFGQLDNEIRKLYNIPGTR